MPVKLHSTLNIMMDYIVLQEPSSSTPYVGSGGDDGASGGRAIDRHNPIIRDEKRLNQGRFFPSSPIITSTTNTVTASMEGGDQKKKTVAFADDDNESIKTFDFISPASSSRCLLSNKPTFDFSSDFYHVPPPSPPHESPPTTPQPPPPPPPYDDLWFLDSDDDDDSLTFSPPKPPPSPPLEPMKFRNSKVFNKEPHDSLSYAAAKPPSLPPPPPPSSDQVVVLEVSLHCRGCEKKLKKHISKIEGVTSFKIEFAAKKVTVVGDVTPLAVLTSVLKVKNAKLLTPATISSSPSQFGSKSSC